MRDNDRAADGAAELMPVEIIGASGKVGAGVEVAVAQELERVAMKLRGASPGNDVNDGPGALAELGIVVAGLDTELLHRVGHGEGRVDVREFVNVVAAVEEVVGLIWQGA